MEINKASWEKLTNHEEEPERYIADLNTTLAKFLQSKPELQHEVKTFYKYSTKSADSLEELRKRRRKKTM